MTVATVPALIPANQPGVTVDYDDGVLGATKICWCCLRAQHKVSPPPIAKKKATPARRAPLSLGRKRPRKSGIAVDNRDAAPRQIGRGPALRNGTVMAAMAFSQSVTSIRDLAVRRCKHLGTTLPFMAALKGRFSPILRACRSWVRMVMALLHRLSLSSLPACSPSANHRGRGAIGGERGVESIWQVNTTLALSALLVLAGIFSSLIARRFDALGKFRLK
jgi:hypothetical protein